ncbi:MAG: hypothetical protein K2W95_07670 [Candidatus Obscuribacterales bacterium]|nr:hypothetical protein [Candidatus Obscuribacterales bacterium]
MRMWQLPLIVFVALIGLVLSASEAQAQDVGQFQQQQMLPGPGMMQQQQQMLPLNGPARGPAAATPAQPPRNYVPGVRYTTGAVTTAGWEKTLTDGDPNLRHWNWSAMTSYTQSSYGKVAPGAFQKDKRPSGGVYVKPVHINPDTFAQKRAPFVPVSARTNAGSQTASNVSGTVRFPRPASQPAEAVAKTYGGNYTNTNVGGQVVAGSGSEARDVYGKLVRRTQ